MKHKLILGRPSSGKTTKAIDIFKSNSNGLYFTLEQLKKNLVDIVGKKYTNYIFDDCADDIQIINKINSLNEKIDFIIIDYLHLLDNLNLDNFLDYLDSYNIKLILVAHVSVSGRIVSRFYDKKYDKIFDKIILKQIFPISNQQSTP